MRTTRWMVSAAALVLAASTGAAGAQYYGQQGPPPPPPGYGQGYGPGYGQGGGWDQAPPQFREAMRRGFNDGVNGARKDFENHRPPNVNNRDEYRKPNFIAPPDRRDYRRGFERGYAVGVQHIYGGNPNRYNRPY